MSFRLKNGWETYQRMLNKFFGEEIGETLKVYMDDMIMKSDMDALHP